MTDERVVAIEKAMLDLFSGGYNYRRFVRDRTRSFLYDTLLDNRYGVCDLDGDELRVRFSALMHGFCAGYVTGVDDKYDESVVHADVADEWFDVMAFAQSGLRGKDMPSCVLPRAYDFLVVSGMEDDSVENHGAMIGAYMYGLTEGIDDVKSHRLDELFEEGGLYYFEQELAKKRIHDSLNELRAFTIDSRVSSLLQLQALCRVIDRVSPNVDGVKLFSSAISMACDVVEPLMIRWCIGRSGYDVRNRYRDFGVQATIMAHVALDEMLKNRVNSSGFDIKGFEAQLPREVLGQISCLARVETRNVGLADCWQSFAMYYAAAFLRMQMANRVGFEGIDPMLVVLIETFGGMLGHMAADNLDCNLSLEEIDEVVRMISSSFDVR